MPRQLSLIASAIFAVSLVLTGLLGFVGPASAASIGSTTRCSNGVDNTPGLGLICQVTIVNTLTKHGGSSAITLRECHGAAGDPTASCKTTHWRLSRPVRIVNQCNNSTNGGGGTLRCSVKVTNIFVGLSANSTAVTINQCVGSGDGIANNCNPFPATTTSAKITQCNGSANGGTLVKLKCTASGTKSGTLGVTINQCNNSTNGGGALVICSASIVNRRVSATTPTSTAPAATNRTTFTQPPTDTGERADTPSSAGNAWASIAILLVAASVLGACIRRTARTR
ncbi:MAG: hypothetical protein H0V73_02735 [Chloroflexi bacterium]|nr:hypothetical protein [Chloroflexota bacterium]